MKKLLLLIVLMISILTTLAQEEPLPISPSSTWQMFWMSMVNPSNYGTFAYHLLEEDTINDTLYYPIETYSYCGENWTSQIFAYLREDSGKWYQRYSESDSEFLLFDFTLDVGISVTLNQCFGTSEGAQTLWVTGIEDILMYDGTTRRKWTLEYDKNSFLSGFEEYWIEGIGNIYLGITASLSQSCIDLNQSLHCFFEQDFRIYPSNEFPAGIDCCTPVGVIENKPINQMMIYPNPAFETINMLGSIGVTKVEICDLSGRMVMEFENSFNTLNVASLSSGYYLLKATTKNETIETLQFLKE